MPNPLRSLCLASLLTLLSATRLAAQSEVTVLPGEPLKLEVVGPSSAPVGAHCAGRVTSVSQDTLIVVAGGSCARGSYLADLRVIRGDRGSRVDHVGVGALAGVLVGALVGRAGAKTDPNTGRISQGPMWAGAALGAAAGGAVGYLLPAGPAWVRAGSPRPLRVIGLEVRPGLEVALR
jgi:hypothetical protein